MNFPKTPKNLETRGKIWIRTNPLLNLRQSQDNLTGSHSIDEKFSNTYKYYWTVPRCAVITWHI